MVPQHSLFRFRWRIAIGLLVLAVGWQTQPSTCLGQAGFGFVQNDNNISNGFGSASPWVNGFSQALIQVPQFQQSPGSAPQLATMRRGFQLGASIQNTPVGVNVQQVMSGSVAQSIGLEQGDTIVAVSGYQVGFVNDRVYDVVDEIQKRMEVTSGAVNLLVLDGRTRALENLRIDANSMSGPVISGLIGIPSGAPLPQGSTLRVELKNISQPFQQVNGGVDLRTVVGYGPFPYELHFDPRYINNRDQYQIIATISTYQGQVLLQGGQPIQTPQGAMNNLNIQMQGMNQVVQASNTNIVSYAPSSDLVVNEFLRIFNRRPDANELPAWLSSLSRGTSPESMRAQLLASPQFYDMSGNNNLGFIRNLLQVVQNRQPTEQEIASYMGLFGSNPSRQAIVQQVMATARR